MKLTKTYHIPTTVGVVEATGWNWCAAAWAVALAGYTIL